MNSHEETFRKHHLFSKEDILESVELLTEYEKPEQDGYSVKIRKNRVRLCEKFKNTLSMVRLPELNELWWYYDYQFHEVKIRLVLCKAEDVEIEDGEISSMTFLEERTLLTVESELLSVEEYAELMKVKSETVAKWIQRGKLRHARKTNDEWLIPDTQDKPKRTFTNVEYIINYGEEIHSHEFPMLAAAETVSIRRDDKNKKVYICHMFRYSDRFLTELELDRSEVERLEYELIESGKAEVDSYVQYMPSIR